jgi:Protein of unknown function (DUF1499)
MALKLPDDQKSLSRWTVRFALFAAMLAAFALVAHRLFAMPTPVALNIGRVSLCLAAVAALVGIASTFRIWRRGTGGGLATLFGMLVSASLLAWPLALLPTARSLPRINDITTDVEAPPRFITLAKARVPGANSVNYPGAGFASAQQKAYPDIRTFQIDRSAEEAYELVLAALRSKTMKFKPVSEEPPKGRFGQPGWIEVVDRTLVVGFTDDVIIRVDGDANNARIDVRSASRYGEHDLGRNAQRVRRILKEIQGQVEATMPSADGTRVSRLRGRGLKTPVPKRLKEADQTSAARRNATDRAKSDVRRAPAPRERQPSQDARQAPGTRG